MSYLGSFIEKYWKEALDREIYHDDYGFFSYEKSSLYELNDSLYIVDMYVDIDHRKENRAKAFLKKAEEIAKELGLKYILTTSNLTSKDPSLGLKAQLAVGFKIYKTDPLNIYLYKTVEV